MSAFLLYATVGALLFPRLFAGRTTVFVLSPQRQGIVEASLAPVSGNISQTAYFVLGGLTAMALYMLLLHKSRIDQVRRGFFLCCGHHAGMGLIDLLCELAGLATRHDRCPNIFLSAVALAATVILWL